MANPRIIYNNLWRKGGNALVSDPVADPQHPVSDTQIDTLSMYWKSSNQATTPTYVPMDLKAGARSINFIAILGHNIDSDAGIIFQEDTIWNFPHPTDTAALTWSATNIFHFLAAPLTEQFVRLKLTRGGGFTVKPQVATIVCGSYFELNKTGGLNYEEGYEDFSELESSDSQVIFAQEKEIIEVRSLPFRGLDDATRANILLFFNECGIHKAFVICFDPTAANTNSYWVVNTELMSPRYQQNDCWHWQLTTREII